MNLPATLHNIQILRSLAALMVLFLHMNSEEENYAGVSGVLPASFDIGHTGVDLFFLISGFVMVYATRLPETRNPIKFFLARLIRIYPIYWLILAVTLLFSIMKGLLFDDQTDCSMLPFDLLLIPTGNLPSLKVAWTLIHEIYFYLVFTIFLFWQRSSLIWFLMTWLFILTLGTSTGMNAVHPLADIVFHPLTIEFIVGACIGLLIIEGAREWGKTTLLAGLIWLLFIAIYRVTTTAPLFPSNWLRVLLSMPPLCLILYGAVVLELKRGISTQPSGIKKFLMQLGDASYVLYLVHLPIMIIVGTLWIPFVSPGKWDNVVLICVWGCASVWIALLVHKWVERPLLRLTRAGTKSSLVGRR
jgi:peptidoglycan/LPS O-acetylase OafA/YrhL